MSNNLYEEVKLAPFKDNLFRLHPSEAKKLAPEFFDVYLEDYQRVFEAWANNNELVNQIIKGRTTFTSQIKTFFLSKPPLNENNIKSLESLVGLNISLAHDPVATGLNYSFYGGLFGGVAGAAVGLNLSQEIGIRRRSFLFLIIIFVASLFGLGAGALGYFGATSTREVFLKRATELDTVVKKIYGI